MSWMSFLLGLTTGALIVLLAIAAMAWRYGQRLGAQREQARERSGEQLKGIFETLGFRPVARPQSSNPEPPTGNPSNN